MKKFDIKKINKTTLELCRIEALKQKYITAPLTIYMNIRYCFSYNLSIEEVSSSGFNRELVSLIYKETF